VDWVRPELLV